MKRKICCLTAFVLAVACVFALCSCGKKEGDNKGKTENGKLVWYMGGKNMFSDADNAESLFEGVADTVDPAKIYASLELTEEMIHGVYMLNNRDEDIKTVRKEIPFEDVKLTEKTYSVAVLPVAVYLGADNICCSETNFRFSEFREISDYEVAVLEFATEDKRGQTPCTYELNGKTITFKQIRQTSGQDEPLAYEFTGAEFSYNFELSGPYMTFFKDGNSLKLKAYCLTENSKVSLSLTGYSLPDSPLIEDLDYFASAGAWDFAIKRDGHYYDVSAFKFDDEGRFTIYLAEKDGLSGKTDKFVRQYAYIIQSSAGILSDFSVILLDGNNIYYYTDSVTKREARVLKDQGVDVGKLTDDEIKEIAEKKSDLFDDLYNEFAAQGINVNINRSTGEISMDASVLFGGDSAVITDEGKALLNKFLAAYTSIIYNEKYDGFISKTLIEGHIAPVSGSTYESGLPLSEERAENVKNYCLSADTGADIARLTSSLEAVGLSNSKPVYGSDGKVDMAACRRVSFRFIVNLDNK